MDYNVSKYAKTYFEEGLFFQWLLKGKFFLKA